MDWTAVRVRGRHWKNRNRTALAAWESQKAHSSSLRAKSHRVEQRKRADAREEATSPTMSTLQDLPQELLEMIFMYSMNISLARASPCFGRMLSSRHVTLEFTMRSFFHTVDYRANIRSPLAVSDPRVQSAILSCRFFTYRFFLTYVKRAREALITLRGKGWESTDMLVPDIHEFDSLFVYKFTKILYLGFANGFHVPEKLLHGPFTKDKAALLYVLVAFSGEVDWKGSLAGEIAEAGMMQAIAENNERVVASLSVLLGIQKSITTGMLRHAVINCGCPINLLRHLLFNAQILARFTPKYVLDFQDPELWAWAAAEPSKGDRLIAMLRKAETFDLEFYFEEENWTNIIGFPYGGSRFDTRTVLNNIVKELLTNLYVSHGRRITRRRTNR